MTIVKEVTVEGIRYPVTVSDDNEALLAAAAAGRAIIGIWNPSANLSGAGFDACLYLVCEAEAADDRLLEKAVRRRYGFPWMIAETERLLIREFTADDPLEPESEDDGGGVFSDRVRRDDYIVNQYRFHECGLWALVEKEKGLIIGKAGITDGELGYHIYRPFRRCGYAFEACRAIIGYAKKELDLACIRLKTDNKNEASVRLAEKLGFTMRDDLRQVKEGLLTFDKRGIYNGIKNI